MAAEGQRQKKVAAGGVGQTKRWLQKEFSRKKVAAAENVGKANPRHKKKERKPESGMEGGSFSVREEERRAAGDFLWESFHCQRGAKGRNSLKVLKLGFFLLKKPGMYTTFLHLSLFTAFP